MLLKGTILSQAFVLRWNENIQDCRITTCYSRSVSSNLSRLPWLPARAESLKAKHQPSKSKTELKMASSSGQVCDIFQPSSRLDSGESAEANSFAICDPYNRKSIVARHRLQPKNTQQCRNCNICTFRTICRPDRTSRTFTKQYTTAHSGSLSQQ